MPVKPADILLNLARSGDVDPWNMDIVNLTDQYIEELNKMKELDIRLSGRAILASSILLRMKSDVLLELGEEEDEEQKEKELEEELQEEFEEIENVDPIVPPARRVKRYYSMDELVEALDEALDEDRDKENPSEKQKSRTKRKKKTKKEMINEIRVKDHRANIKSNVEDLHEEIKNEYQKGEKVKFNDLVLESTPKGISRTFLYLLYLINEDKVEIDQKNEYGEIFIIPR